MTETFILNNVEDLDKLSCHSHNPKVLKLIQKLDEKGITLDKLKEKIISGPMGFHLHTYDYVPETFPNAVKLLQISNMDEFGEIKNSKRDKFISADKDEELNKSRVIKGDLIIAKTGEIGRLALFNEDYSANLNQALGIIRLKKEFDGIKVIPEFMHLYLNSYYATEQFNRLGGFRAGQSGLSLDEIGSIFVLLPKEEEQIKIINKLRKTRKEAIKHYKEYLRYADESKRVILDILKIPFPSEDNKMYIFENEINDRIDAIYNSPFRNKLISNIKKSKYLLFDKLLKEAENKFKFSDYYNIIDLDNIDENLSEIISWEEVKVLNSTKTIFKKDNLLISKLGGEKGNIIVIEEKYDGFLGSGELVAFSLQEESPVSLEYIFYLLRSPYLSKQIEYSLSGCSRMRLASKGMKNLAIPLPENETEEKKIIQKVRELRVKAIFEKKQYELKKLEVFNKFKDLLEKYL